MQMQVNELFLSDVLDKKVIDSRGNPLGRLHDLVMAPGEGFPEVCGLQVKNGGSIRFVRWRDILLFNPFVITVGPDARMDEYVPREGEILVKRDILDKQIVDVNGAKVVRVNDLKLGTYEEVLCIFAVDVGFRGILRRLGYTAWWEKLLKLLRREIPRQEISWQFVQPLEMNLSRLTLTVARDQMSEMHPADIASIISQIPHQQARAVLISLDTETAGEAIHELEPELRSRIISQLDSEQASDILEEMAPDEAADVLIDLPEEKAQELLGLMDAEEAEEIQELMEHEEGTAGSLMTSEFVSIDPAMTVAQVLERVKEQAPEIESVYYAYALDAGERPLGVVSLKELLLLDPSAVVEEVMTENLKTVDISTEPEDVLEIIARYNLIAVPVLDEEGKMAGIITIDDILELFLPYALKRRRHHHH